VKIFLAVIEKTAGQKESIVFIDGDITKKTTDSLITVNATRGKFLEDIELI
jgi:hypothetical protein